MSIGGNVSLGGNLNLSGMQGVWYTQTDAAAPAEVCTGPGGGPGSGNGGPSGGGGSCRIRGGSGNGGGIGGAGNGAGGLWDPVVLLRAGGAGWSSGGGSNGGGSGGSSGMVLGNNHFLPGLGALGGSDDGSGVWDRSLLAADLLCAPVSGPTPGCVSPGTRIALFPDGCKAAGEVEVGDLLLTRTAEGKLVGEAVTAVRTSEQPCLILVTEDGQRLHCSHSHEVMVEDAAHPCGRRTMASRLTCVDRLLREDGEPVAVAAILPDGVGPVIQLSLAGPHHVYLSEGIWSHNKLYPLSPWVWPPAGSITP